MKKFEVKNTESPFIYSGEKAWKILQSLPSYDKFFFDSYKILYRPSYSNDFIEVEFCWMLKRNYNHSYDKNLKAPFWELCISLPPNPGNYHSPNYRPPHFIWNDDRGLKEIFIQRIK